MTLSLTECYWINIALHLIFDKCCNNNCWYGPITWFSSLLCSFSHAFTVYLLWLAKLIRSHDHGHLIKIMSDWILTMGDISHQDPFYSPNARLCCF